ncbi:RagB/SusD family nutrient uptake outer membrane protein [Sphingobacterium faecale]|uniref:RagB/SusD family nutrient uptake outer membrane protein n=1 Tax=Sphingobacterium faecale TaxID=2803775 RepID=A0ABS1QYA9_9SPHI|nr:RagB/SusD family nutrient uptake outer membrane protein [Sphingobacterium faecale]MBL1407420.1 RagB/SusD family nutrient uptake outer membrane protein [Sphingobacterium faecale]
MKIKIYKYIGLSIAWSMFSCSAILDVKPTDAIDASESLVTSEDFETATVGSYSYLRATSLYGRQLISYPEFLGNNVSHHGRVATLLTLSNNARGVHMTPWLTSYQALAQINMILDQLEKFQGDVKRKNKIRGQLLFLRSLYYHNLSKVYGYEPKVKRSTDRGTVPLRLNAIYSYDKSENLARATSEEMYAHLYKELEEAYVLLSDQPTNQAPFFATAGSVAALFSRVALYNADYEGVIKWSTIALESGVGRLSTKDSYVSDWRAISHPESMFEVEFKVDQNLGVDNAIRSDFTNRVDPEATVSNGGAPGRISDELYTLFEDSDVRKKLIVKGLGAASNDNQMTKFFSRGGAPNLDNIPVIRISEMYLNRAEAYAHMQGGESAALMDLNRIRTRAGLAPAGGLAEQALIDEILKQRRLELCFEGHNFFDYKRLGLNIIKANGTTFQYSDYRVLGRIPWRDVTTFSNMKQNSGY